MKTDFGKNMIDKYLADSQPEYAIVMYGTNDAKTPEAVKAGMENLACVIDACVTFGTVPIMATIPPKGYDKEKQDGQVRFNEALVQLCREKKVPVTYAYALMMTRDLKTILSDGTHLVPDTGNDAAGEALWQTFEQIEWALRDTTAGMK